MSLPSDNLVHPDTLAECYQRMRERQGFQNWWPGDGPLEISIGAILTQNTQWSNVEKALANLREVCSLEDIHHLLSIPENVLHRLLQPSGYFRLKSSRVRQFLWTLIQFWNASIDQFLTGDTATVRTRLLAISGIGPETADSILLYAGNHPIFVVDAYTRRIFSRHGWCQPDADYATLQKICSVVVPATLSQVDYLQDYHAQLVMIGKNYCRPRQPLCGDCPLNCFPHVIHPIP